MVNGIYTASEGMKHLLNKTEVVSHNLANASTTGFKKSYMLAESEVIVKRNDEWKLHQDENSWVEGNHVDYEHGPTVQTGDPLDFAVQGDGFFAVETPQGQRYTRNGTFSRNANGELVTLGGNPVLDQNGQHIKIDGGNLQVSSDGNISVDNRRIAKLALYDFKDKTGLTREGGTFFNAKAPSQPVPSQTSTLKQGYLEGSNVNAIDSMVELIRYQRNYESDQKALQSCDETLEKAVSDVGKVS